METSTTEKTETAERIHCRSCGAEIEGRRDKVYCSDRCRKADARRGAEEDAGSPPECAASTAASVQLESPSGLRGEDTKCSVHGCWYLRIHVTSYNVWIGQCPECKVEEELKGRAQELLSRRRAAIDAKIEGLLPGYEDEVQHQADADAQAYLAGVRPQFVAEVRARLWERLEQQIVAEELSKLVADLKASKGA